MENVSGLSYSVSLLFGSDTNAYRVVQSLCCMKVEEYTGEKLRPNKKSKDVVIRLCSRVSTYMYIMCGSAQLNTNLQQMQIIEKVFFRKKCHKFRVCRSTKVKLIYYWCPSTDFAMLPHQITLHDEPNVFTVDDGSGMSVKILTQSRECIAATFYRFLLNISGLP